MHTLDSIALATQDAKITGVSKNIERHPLYGTPSFGVQAKVSTLSNYECALAELLLAQGRLSEIGMSLRSGLAQLGIDGFLPESVEIRMKGGNIEIETLLTDLVHDDGKFLMRILESRQRGAIARVLLLPKGACIGSEHMLCMKDRHYSFDQDALSNEQLASVMNGISARATILSVRNNLGNIPQSIEPRHRFVGAIDVEVGDECWVIEPTLLKGGKKTSVRHAMAVCLDPVRSTGERQVELFNTGSQPMLLANLIVQISRYRTKTHIFHCDHLEGV